MIGPHFAGQQSPEQLIDRYGIACRPVRDLLADYLRERQPGIDYNSLVKLATALVPFFWKYLEAHHPGISSLHLTPAVAAAWKKRLRTRTIRTPGGGEQAVARESADDNLMIIRAFYLDLAQCALDDPARWGPWAAPCPIRASDIQYKKQKSRTKARMDARTRERLPVLPALAAAAGRARTDAAARLGAARAAAPGELFTAGGQELVQAGLHEASRRTWAEDLAPAGGATWAARRATRSGPGRPSRSCATPASGSRSSPSSRTTAWSSTGSPAVDRAVQDRHRTPLVVSPELADVLSAVITRARGTDGAVPLVPSYDTRERTWNPPMPLLFQRTLGLENRPVTADGIRRLLRSALAASAITGTDGRPLTFQPHDFRRIFTTDAILNGMPPHIAQLILGHDDINTTMGQAIPKT